VRVTKKKLIVTVTSSSVEMKIPPERDGGLSVSVGQLATARGNLTVS
jgi:hypothetical protein